MTTRTSRLPSSRRLDAIGFTVTLPLAPGSVTAEPPHWQADDRPSRAPLEVRFHRRQAVLLHRRDGACHLVWQEVGGPDDARARTVGKHRQDRGVMRAAPHNLR